MLTRLVFFAFFTAIAIFAAVTTYWQDIIAQPDSAAAFLGALAGAGGGLLAIILGALINAELNRRRDDRLRDQERVAIAIAVQVELAALGSHAANRRITIRKWRAQAKSVTGDWMSACSQHRTSGIVLEVANHPLPRR